MLHTLLGWGRWEIIQNVDWKPLGRLVRRREAKDNINPLKTGFLLNNI
jgi:hypothetical protein